MKQTTAPTPQTPSPTDSFKPSPGSMFTGMALDMSWRLAIVILVPIIGGAELDKHLKTTPVLLIVGFVLAMAGMGLVMRRTLQVADRLAVPKKGRRT